MHVLSEYNVYAFYVGTVTTLNIPGAILITSQIFSGWSMLVMR